jgi:hypothetical protein
MKLICKQCAELISAENINIKDGVCYCPRCDEVFKIASFLSDSSVVNRIEKPVSSRVQHYADPDSMGFIIPPSGLAGGGYFFLFFSLFWNAVTWTGFIASIRSGEVFPILFLIPFLLVGAITFAIFLYFIKGEFALLANTQHCHGSWSLGNLKYNRKVSVNEITDIVEEVIYTKNYQPVYGIGIKAGKGKSLKFGSGLTEDERKWMIGELRYFLKK